MYKRLENLLLEGALSGASRAYLKHARAVRAAINNTPGIDFASKRKKEAMDFRSVPAWDKAFKVNKLIPRKRKRENDYVRTSTIIRPIANDRLTTANYFRQRRKVLRPTTIKSKDKDVKFYLY